MQVGFLHIRVNKAAMVAKLLACSFPGRLIKTKYNVLCNLYSGVRTRFGWLGKRTLRENIRNIPSPLFTDTVES